MMDIEQKELITKKVKIYCFFFFFSQSRYK